MLSHYVKAQLGVSLGRRYITAVYFEDSRPQLAARLEGTPEYLDLMEGIVNSVSDGDRPLTAIESSAAERIITENLAKIKRASSSNTQKPLRIGSVALQLDLELTLMARSVRMALKEAMHNLEGDLMDRTRVITSATANFLTNGGNFCRSQVLLDGTDPRREDVVLAVELAFVRVYVSLGMVDRRGTVTDPAYRRVRDSTEQELIDAINELAHHKPDEIVGGIVVGSMSTQQLRDVMKSIRSALPHLVDKIAIPLGDPDLVTAVGAACHAWDLIAYPHKHDWDPENIRHAEQ